MIKLTLKPKEDNFVQRVIGPWPMHEVCHKFIVELCKLSLTIRI